MRHSIPRNSCMISLFPEKQGDFTSNSYNILTDDNIFTLVRSTYVSIIFCVLQRNSDSVLHKAEVLKQRRLEPAATPQVLVFFPLPNNGICKIMTFPDIVDWKEEKVQWRNVHCLIRNKSAFARESVV